MNRKMRDQAIRVFMTKEKVSVMLMSLKCGGVGLNLTRANRKFLSPPHAESALRRPQGVISLDLGWSPAVENQAFDRVHRLGQQRDVTVQRLVITNTVEGRILTLQNRKVIT
jgi:SNF2 family DNA or RNA helicase